MFITLRRANQGMAHDKNLAYQEGVRC